jgi:hypothetical protein
MIRLKHLLNEATTVAGVGSTKHYEGDVFKVAKDFNSANKFGLKVGSNSKNPNSTKVPLPRGYEIVFDEQSGSGQVWFTFINPQTKKKERGYTDSGSLKNMISSGNIKYVRGRK